MAIQPTNRRVSQEYGVFNSAYKYNHHAGRDYACPGGDPVKAPANGRILEYNITNSGKYSGYGKVMRMATRYGFEHWFTHLSAKAVPIGRVKEGQVIARSGNTGWSTGPHLHHEIRWKGMPVDPRLWLWLENKIDFLNDTIKEQKRQISNQAKQIKVLKSAVAELSKRPTQAEVDGIRADLDKALKDLETAREGFIADAINKVKEFFSWT